jgi:hypothetical protein
VDHGGWLLHGDISGKGSVVTEAKAGAGDWQRKLRCVFVAKPHISSLMKTVLSGAIDASDWCGWVVVLPCGDAGNCMSRWTLFSPARWS